MKLSEITAYLNIEIPPALQESYDNSGLLIGNPQTEILGALICVDVTEAIVDEAIEKGCNLIISHHPLIFTGLKTLTGKNETERIVIRAISLNLAIFALHTNLDNHPEGVNAILCEKLGLIRTKILRPTEGQLRKLITFSPETHADDVRQALFDAGAGHIGKYDSCSFNLRGEGTYRALPGAKPFAGTEGVLHTEPEVRIETIFPAHRQNAILQALRQAHPYEEIAFDLIPLVNKNGDTGAGMTGFLPEPVATELFLQMLKNIFGTGCIRHTSNKINKIKKVAVCGGSGSFLIGDAIASDADIYITGDLKYHDFFIPGDRMILADIGHYESEQFTKELIYTLLKKKFTTFALFISGTCTNPVNYL
jgi:dinuclear metal center YbgI/SA1388 family protein